MSLTSFPKSTLFDFIRKRSGPFDGEVELDSKRVYILPTKTGVLFGVLLLLLLLGSINYEKSLGYALTFLLAGIGNIALFVTWKNLRGIVLKAGGCAPVFAGEQARFSIRCFNPDATPRYSIAVTHEDVEYDVIDIAADASAQLHFDVPAEKRGLLKPGVCKLSTEFPVGLFVAWTWVDLNMQCLVYPSPASKIVRPIVNGDQEGESDTGADGFETFEGLRSFQKGDSWRRISWKAYARNNELMIKQFSGGAPVEEWIDWQAIPVSDKEEKLSIMCRLVIDAENQKRHYGIRLPGIQLKPDNGRAHMQHCLKQLALYD